MTTLQVLADRVAQGGVLDQHDAPIVFQSHDLIAIGMMADDVRRQLHGAETTFLRVFDVHVDAVPASLPPGASAGEFRLVGVASSVDSACYAVAETRRLAGGAVVSGFSIPEVCALESASGGALARLRAAGLDAVADAPLDRLSADDVRAVRDAGLLVQRLTVHAPPTDPLATIEAARRLQEEVGGFRAFAPLPRTSSVTAPTTGYEDVKVIALARLVIRDIPSIQVDWPLYGPKLAQVALTVGADDVDDVAAFDTGSLGTRRSPLEVIKGNIRAAGLHAVERDGRFEVREH